MTKESRNHAIINILFQLLLFHLSMNSNLADGCPPPCTCRDDQHLHVDCSSKLLLKPPKTSLSTLSLDLSHNALGPILNASFVQMRNLTLIDLSKNALTLLLDCTFSGLLGLKTVRLNGNRLTSLPDGLFTDATKVEHLDLSHNLFVELSHVAFKNLPQLRILDMSHNLILQLKLGPRFQVPRHIQVIDISHNQIEAIQSDSFEIASTWEASTGRTINLAFCRITSIDSGALSKIPNLHDLDLSGNSGVSMEMLRDLIKELESGARNLDRLSLAYMNLSTIAPLFTHVSQHSLKFLNVSFNKINDVPANVFSTIRSLQVLDLSRNVISTLPEGLSDLVNLRVLNVSHNRMESFQGDAVTQFSNLRTLDVSQNKLTDSNNVNFSPLTKLNYLDANNNFLASVILPCNTSNIQFLDYHSNRITEFNGLDDAARLETVDLSDNDLESVAGFLFRGGKLLKLANFSKNSIEKIDHRAFLPQSPLIIDLSHNFLKDILYSNWVATQKLYLGHNEIIQIDNQAFYGMTGLEELHLSQNKLVTLHEDLFHYLINMKHLNLSYNGLGNLPWLHLFRNLQKLETLDLGHNNISNLNESMILPLLKIQALYLQANHLQTIIPRVFRDVNELKIIDLSDNPFDCDCDMLAFKDWLKRTKISIMRLYKINSTAYHCRTPLSRAGVHVLNWSVEDFECNRSILIIIIICSTGVFFSVVGMVGIAAYRFYKQWKDAKERRRKLKEEVEEMRKQAQKMEIARLSNQEIAQAIQEAIDRKNRLKRRKYETTGRHNDYVPSPGKNQRRVELDKNKRRHENSEKKDGTTGSDRNVRKERKTSEGRRYEKLMMEELAREQMDKQRRKESDVSLIGHPERVAGQREHNDKRKNYSGTRGEQRQSGSSNVDPYLYDRQVIPLRTLPHRYEDVNREARSRDQNRLFYYEREPRYKHAVEPARNGPYIISSANISHTIQGSRDPWSIPRGETTQGYRRARNQDPRMDVYSDTELPRHGIVRERVLDYTNDRFPFDAHFEEEEEPTYYTRQRRADPYPSYYDPQRSQSYNILPHKLPYLKRDRAQKQYEIIKRTSGNHGIGPRAVSQPFLARDRTTDWL